MLDVTRLPLPPATDPDRGIGTREEDTHGEVSRGDSTLGPCPVSPNVEQAGAREEKPPRTLGTSKDTRGAPPSAAATHGAGEIPEKTLPKPPNLRGKQLRTAAGVTRRSLEPSLAVSHNPHSGPLRTLEPQVTSGMNSGCAPWDFPSFEPI